VKIEDGPAAVIPPIFMETLLTLLATVRLLVFEFSTLHNLSGYATKLSVGWEGC